MIGTGIGAVAGGIGGFMSPNDSMQERIVSGVGGAIMGGFIGGGITSAMNYRSTPASASMVTGGAVRKGTSTKFARAVKKPRTSVPGGRISNLASGVAGQAPSFSSGNPSTGTNGTKHSSYYDQINKVKKSGSKAQIHVAYVDAINHANRKGNSRALSNFANDPYVSGKKLLMGKVQGLWA